MKTFPYRHPVLNTCLKLGTIIIFVLAVTVPFAWQAFSHDGPLVVDFAIAQMDNPLRQHIDDFDYFGIRYDEFTNTHPRFLSFYLSLVVRAFGPSEVPVHLSLVIFPVIGAVSMYYLGRRFRVSGMGAALLFIAGPIALVSAHVEMVDMPGTCLWIASITAFIHGVDLGRKLLLALASLLFLMTIFTFYQGLSVLALALIYLVIKKRCAVRYLVPIAIPAIAFLFYLFLFYRYYGELPRFTYRIALPEYDKTAWNQLRGLLVIIGGAAMFPLVALFGFVRNWRIALVGVAAAATAFAWVAVRYELGSYLLLEAIALGLFVATGIAVAYAVAEQTFAGIASWFRGRDNDLLLPAAWFFGVFIYCIAFLGYPSPRYFLPAWPALVLLMLVYWRDASFRWRLMRPALAGAGLGLMLAYGLIISISYADYASEARDTAAWALEEYGDHDGRVWFAGELGYSWYMRENGYSMVPGVYWDRYAQTTLDAPPELPQSGDIIIASSLAGFWLPYPDVLPFMRTLETRKTASEYPVVVWAFNDRSSWGTTLLLPYVPSFRPVYTDEIIVFEIVDDPATLPPEVKREVNKWKR